MLAHLVCLCLGSLPLLIGLLVSKAKFNQGYAEWTQDLVMSTAEWKQRKAAACAAGSDSVLSTNYHTVANLVNLRSNPARKCVPLGDRKLELATYHVNELGYPADYPYAAAVPNPLVTEPRSEGQVLTAQVYRLSCDFDANFFAPVYYMRINRTELQTSSEDW